jgi:hypothetical protein
MPLYYEQTPGPEVKADRSKDLTLRELLRQIPIGTLLSLWRSGVLDDYADDIMRAIATYTIEHPKTDQPELSTSNEPDVPIDEREDVIHRTEGPMVTGTENDTLPIIPNDPNQYDWAKRPRNDVGWARPGDPEFKGVVPKRNVSQIIAGKQHGPSRKQRNRAQHALNGNSMDARFTKLATLLKKKRKQGKPKKKTVAVVARPKIKASGFRQMFNKQNTNAVSYSQSRGTYVRIAGAPSKMRYKGVDLDGIRIHGHQLLANLEAETGTIGCFDEMTGGASVTTKNSIRISPDLLNGRVALLANGFDKYVFRKVKIYFVPRVAATEVGQVSWGLLTDSQYSFTVSFASVTQMAKSCIFQIREPCEINVTDRDSNNEVFFTKADVTSGAAARQCVQFVLLGARDATDAISTVYGTIMIQYVLDLYEPVADQSITLRSRTGERVVVPEAKFPELLSAARIQYGLNWPNDTPPSDDDIVECKAIATRPTSASSRSDRAR